MALNAVARLLPLAVVEAGFSAEWDNEGGFAYDAQPCQLGKYFPGGSVTGPSLCLSCGGYVTRNKQSTSLADCLAPPGYYLDNTGPEPALQRCPASISYQEYNANMNPAYKTFGTYR